MAVLPVPAAPRMLTARSRERGRTRRHAFVLALGGPRQRIDRLRQGARSGRFRDYEINHLAFPLEAADGGDFVTVPQNRAGGLLQGERTFQLRVVDVPAPVAKCFRQNLVIARN